MKKWISISFFLLLFASFKGASAQPVNPEPAKVIPDFTFFLLNGDKHFTRDQLPVSERLVFIFFDPDCHYCQDELSELGEHLSEFKNAAFYLVAMQDKPIILDFMNKYGLKLKDKENVTVLQDANTEFIPKFQPSKYPALFVYGEDHRLINYLDGPKPIKTLLKVINH